MKIKTEESKIRNGKDTERNENKNKTTENGIIKKIQSEGEYWKIKVELKVKKKKIARHGWKR